MPCLEISLADSIVNPVLFTLLSVSCGSVGGGALLRSTAANCVIEISGINTSLGEGSSTADDEAMVFSLCVFFAVNGLAAARLTEALSKSRLICGIASESKFLKSFVCSLGFVFAIDESVRLIIALSDNFTPSSLSVIIFGFCSLTGFWVFDSAAFGCSISLEKALLDIGTGGDCGGSTRVFCNEWRVLAGSVFLFGVAPFASFSLSALPGILVRTSECSAADICLLIAKGVLALDFAARLCAIVEPALFAERLLYVLRFLC
jgi:hypothetical protein